MFSRNTKRLLKYGFVGAAGLGTFLSLRANNYDLNSIGVVRLGRAAVAVFDISLNYRRNLYSRNLDKSSTEYLETTSLCHKQAAEKLLELCCTNKGVYIKVGQHLAALDYLLPPEYVQTMRVLHSHAPSNTMEEVRRVIREELGREPDEVFASIEPKPLGVASLAQVHRAIKHDGTVVAVKVQHPYVKGNAVVDINTMETLVHLVSWAFHDFNFQWLVDETKKNLPKELDFRQDAQNAERLASTVGSKYPWLKVPSVHWDLTTSRLLTMDFLDGGQVNDVQYIRNNNIDPSEVTDKLGTLYSHMIFIDGFVHSDPHPGNILVKRNGNGRNCDIILLDHGLYANLTSEFRSEYAALWLSILNVDKLGMRAHSHKLGIKGDLYPYFACMVTGRTWDAVLGGVDKTGKPSAAERTAMRREFPNVLPQISNILKTVDSQMLLVLKTNDLLRGIEHTLGTYARMNSFKVMSRCCVRSVYEERIRQAQTKVQRFRITVAQYWVLFKISFYYTMISVVQSVSAFF